MLFSVVSSVILSLGGASVLIYGLSRWLGQVWAQRIINAEQARHSKELEVYKTQLQVAQATLGRYYEHQFESYSCLWESLYKAKIAGDKLMNVASQENLLAFSDRVAELETAILANMLLLEEDHYQRLLGLIGTFQAFEFGKTTLIQLRRGDHIDGQEISSALAFNHQFFTQYNQLLRQIATTFKSQLRLPSASMDATKGLQA